YSPQVDSLGPDMQKSLVGLEIARGHGSNEVLYLLRVQGRIDDRKCSAHANSHQVDLGQAMAVSYKIDHIVQISIHMVVNCQVTVLSCRIAPIDHVNIDSHIQEILDDAPSRLQIEHSLTIDQRI